MTDRQTLMREEKMYKLFLRFSIPAIAGMLVQSLYNIVDRIFIGNIPIEGGLAISGIGVVLPVTFILMAFAMLFGIGSGANISIKLGQKKHDDAERILGTGLFMLVAAGIFMSAVGLIFLDDIVNLYGANDSIRPYAMDYLRIILYGTTFNTIAFGLNNIIRAEGNPKVAMFTMLIGAIGNTILDPIFIYGFKMGVVGAAWATIIAQFMSFIWTISYFLRRKGLLTLRKKYIVFHWEIVLKIMSIGASPFSMQVAGSLIGIIINNSLMTYGSAKAIGAYAAINSIVVLFLMSVFGMNQGLQPIIGFNYGAKNFHRVKEAVNVGVFAATCVSTLGYVLVQLYPEVFINFITQDPEIREIGVVGIKRFFMAFPVIGIQIISANFFQAIGKAQKSFILSMLRQVFLLIPLLLILPGYFGMGLMGIWTAMPVADTLATIITVLFIRYEFKLLSQKETEKLDEERERINHVIEEIEAAKEHVSV
ncbi:MATE family efflux transporter [Youngiibacter fragilis]|uniref:Multidrug export protein MepA n=1 Tax=Youngiibacter fragilis 232.1 TaxID=994573 RepID=V7I4J9_9CLOT|nr:MATE family efflux transporter [Youngiibacter fragilis]ETA80813.1 multidrug transporter MatE [Youngiibacter fragilis 232.1]